MRATGALLVLLLWIGGCAERDRSNPLDPHNQETGGLLAGFNALAGDHQVELRWTRLTQTGVLGYRLLRSIPGGSPEYIGEIYASNLAGAVDSTVLNGETYIYRLVAQLASGDSVSSPPDTASPGTRKIDVLAAGVPGLAGLTPDARDLLFVLPSEEAFEDMELDRIHGVLWLTLPGAGVVLRDRFDGTSAGVPLQITGPADVSVSNNQRSLGWIAIPSSQKVEAFEVAGTVFHTIGSVGETHVVEVGTTVWIGNQNGTVYRYLPDGLDPLGKWELGGSVIAIAMDERSRSAWVATRVSESDPYHDTIYRIDSVDSTVALVRSGLLNVADVAFDSLTQSLWVSERGVPRAGGGRLSRLAQNGDFQVAIGGIEPFGISFEPETGDCWASDLKSNRVIQVSPDGSILRWSATINVPYGLRTWNGSSP
jgi:hypothetical protein